MHTYLVSVVLPLLIFNHAPISENASRTTKFYEMKLSSRIQSPLYCEVGQDNINLGEMSCARRCADSSEEPDVCYAFTLLHDSGCKLCYESETGHRQHIATVSNLQSLHNAKSMSFAVH